jgi:hypothetical protein
MRKKHNNRTYTQLNIWTSFETHTHTHTHTHKHPTNMNDAMSVKIDAISVVWLCCLDIYMPITSDNRWLYLVSLETKKDTVHEREREFRKRFDRCRCRQQLCACLRLLNCSVRVKWEIWRAAVFFQCEFDIWNVRGTLDSMSTRDDRTHVLGRLFQNAIGQLSCERKRRKQRTMSN